MTSRVDHPRLRACRIAGFTMIELIVVMVIMGLILSLIVSRGPMFSRSLTLKEAAGEVAAGLRETRSYAIGADHPASLTLNLVDKSFLVPGRAPHRLPQSFDVTLMSTTGEVRQGRDPGIRFDPDGSSTGGRIILADGSRKLAIGVDWLNGRVRIANVP